MLTANADGLIDGLDDAANQMDRFSKTMHQKMYNKASNGGLLDNLLSGGSMGGGFGVGLAVVGAGLAAAGAALDLIADGLERVADPELRKGMGLDDEQNAKIESAIAAFDRLSAAGDHLLGEAAAGLASAFEAVTVTLAKVTETIEPLIGRVSMFAGEVLATAHNALSAAFGPALESVMNALGETGPLLDNIGEGFRAYGFIITSIAGEIGELIGWAIDQIIDLAKWCISSADDWSESMTGIRASSVKMVDVVFGAFDTLGKGVGHVWDSMKYGAGTVAMVFGQLIGKLGDLLAEYQDKVKLILDSMASIADLGLFGVGSKSLADQLRAAGAALDKIGAKTSGIGAEMEKWGRSQMAGFGQSAEQISNWLKKIRTMFDNKGGPDIAGSLSPDKLAGAHLDGSKEAYSIMAKFNAAAVGANSGDTETRQLDESRQQTQILRKIESKIGGNVGVI
ncbi:MAG: hypothetical protein LC104_06670 [Bacteroidales bacterium]|nr:hypothetical protein [Bacteroidales bacterium]